MPPWLKESLGNGQELHIDALTYKLVIAFAMGGAVAFLYWITHRRDETLTRSFLSTLVLLSILIAMVTQVIGDSVARAFSLVGALSIVRFRTVVEDTRDTAFVIFSVIVGMAVGAGHLEVALMGLVVVGLAAAVMGPRRPATSKSMLPYWSVSVRVGIGKVPEALYGNLFEENFTEIRLLEATTSRQGAALDLTYRVLLRPTSNPTTVISALNTLDGVQNVEMRSL
jgi:hypothetical protein